MREKGLLLNSTHPNLVLFFGSHFWISFFETQRRLWRCLRLSPSKPSKPLRPHLRSPLRPHPSKPSKPPPPFVLTLRSLRSLGSPPPFVLAFEAFEAPFVLTLEAFEAPSSSFLEAFEAFVLTLRSLGSLRPHLRGFRPSPPPSPPPPSTLRLRRLRRVTGCRRR